MTHVHAVFERPADRDAEFKGKPGVVRLLELPPRRCVMIDGKGPPGPDAFTPRMPGLYTTAYKLRFGLKDRGVVTRVGPLEGLWWTTDGSVDLDAIFTPGEGASTPGEGASTPGEGDFTQGDRSTWRWTLFIALPDEATAEEIDGALAAGRAKLEPEFAANLRAEVFDEGRVVQLLHVGPYAAERASIEHLHAAAAAAGLRLRGRHHELYLGNPQTSAPERLRTILRQPVE